MKYFFFIFMCFLLMGCFAPREKSYADNSILAKKWIYEYYPEWGIRRIVGEFIFLNGNNVSERDFISLLNNNSFCYNMVTELRGSYAERLFVNENGELSLECLGLVNNPFYYEDNNMFISVLNNKARTRLESKREEKYFRVTYRGAKMDLNVTQYKRDSLYEFMLPINEPVYSLILRSSPKDLEGCKPLKLDSSILPLESPGYKKLREQ